MTISVRRNPRFIASICLPITAASAFLAVSHAATARPAHMAATHVVTPAPGSAERKAITNALRAHTLKMLGGNVPGASSNQIIFVIHHLNVDRGWAFVTVDPRSADGKWRGDTFSELLHKIKGRWIPIDAPDMEASDENFSQVKAMSKFRAKHPQAPRDIF